MTRTAPVEDRPHCRIEWERFNEFCDHEGIGEHPDDWLPWWKCFQAGIAAFVESL